MIALLQEFRPSFITTGMCPPEEDSKNNKIKYCVVYYYKNNQVISVKGVVFHKIPYFFVLETEVESRMH